MAYSAVGSFTVGSRNAVARYVFTRSFKHVSLHSYARQHDDLHPCWHHAVAVMLVVTQPADFWAIHSWCQLEVGGVILHSVPFVLPSAWS